MYAYDPKTLSGFVNEAFAAAMSSFFVKVVEKKVNKAMSFRENNSVVVEICYFPAFCVHTIILARLLKESTFCPACLCRGFVGYM